MGNQEVQNVSGLPDCPRYRNEFVTLAYYSYYFNTKQHGHDYNTYIHTYILIYTHIMMIINAHIHNLLSFSCLIKVPQIKLERQYGKDAEKLKAPLKMGLK